MRRKRGEENTSSNTGLIYENGFVKVKMYE